MIKLDGKVYGELYKAKNGERIPDDEYVAFFPKDNAVPATLQFYRKECINNGCDMEQITEIDNLIERVRSWRKANPHRLKNADVAGEIFLDVENGQTKPTPEQLKIYEEMKKSDEETVPNMNDLGQTQNKSPTLEQAIEAHKPRKSF